MQIITEINDYVGLGITRPLHAFIGAERVVLKNIDNDETHIALFNELLGYEMASFFGIKYPEFGVAHYREDITKVNWERFEGYSIENNQLFTYTIFQNKIFQLSSPRMAENVPTKDILSLIVFDVFICNTDRHQANLFLEMPTKNSTGPTLFPIDYTHILPGQCLWQDILRQNEYSVKSIVNDVFTSNSYQYLIEEHSFNNDLFEEVTKELSELINKLNFSDLLSSIHNDLTSLFEQEELDLVIKYFEYMRENFYEIIREVKLRIGRGD